jgi:hypothetical protein
MGKSGGSAMSESAAASTVGETKPCKVCGEAIKLAARKCIHCDSYQDWHADIGMSSTMLSLLIALFSVLTVSVPVVRDAITPSISNLKFSYQGTASKIITVLVANTGVRTGTVRYPMALHVAGIGKKFGDFALYLTPKQAEERVLRDDTRGGAGGSGYDVLGAAEMIGAGESKLINLFISPADLPNDLAGVNFGGECSVTMWETNFQGKSSIVGIPFNCADVRTTLGN